MRHFLLQTERVHAQLGRYTAPDEHPFNLSYGFPEPIIKKPAWQSQLKPNAININEKILDIYVNDIIPQLCKEGDDAHYGSSSVCDISALQALSRRIHYGKYVAEAKFQKSREKFTALILAKNAKGLMDELTDVKVEDAVVARVLAKASRYGTDGTDVNSTVNADGTHVSAYKVRPEVVAKLYRDYLIPLNKDVQVEYLLQRLL